MCKRIADVGPTDIIILWAAYIV